jgi:hypothetical protein
MIEPLSIPSLSATQGDTADSGVSISPRAEMELLRQFLPSDIINQEWSTRRKLLKISVRTLLGEIYSLRAKWIAHGGGQNISTTDAVKLMEETKDFVIKTAPQMAQNINKLVDQLPERLPNPQQSTSSPLPQPEQVPSRPPYSIPFGSRPPLFNLQLSLGLPSFLNWLRRLQARSLLDEIPST